MSYCLIIAAYSYSIVDQSRVLLQSESRVCEEYNRATIRALNIWDSQTIP